MGAFCTLWKTAELRPLVTEADFDILQATQLPPLDESLPEPHPKDTDNFVEPL